MQKKDNTTPRDIHVQYIVSAIMGATIECKDWNKPEFTLDELNRTISIWEFLIRAYGDYPVQELSLEMVRGILDSFDNQPYAMDKGFKDKVLLILKAKIQDNERFEEWLRTNLKKTLPEANLENDLEVEIEGFQNYFDD